MDRGTDERVVKALTIRQPWAACIVEASKTIEVRTRRTHHRGPLAIHAAARFDSGYSRKDFPDLPLGAVVGMVQLLDCRPLVPADAEAALFEELTEEDCEGLWAWVLAEPEELIEPLPCKGYQNFWTMPDDVAEALNTAHDHPGYWLTGSDAGAALCREVGSPRLRLLYDCYHMQISEGDLAVHIERNIDVIGHFHAAGVPGRHEPYAGEINYPFLLEHIRRLGYRGVFALEYGPSIDDQESLRRCRAHLSGATADREGEVDA